MSTAAAAAAEAATTDWTTYDGVVPQDLMFYAVFFPVVMGALLVIPATICYLCLARGRVTPYAPPNMPGGFGMFLLISLAPRWPTSAILLLLGPLG